MILKIQTILFLLQWPLIWCASMNFANQFNSSLGSNAIVNTENVREILRNAKSAEIRTFLKNYEEPCDNFYRFACGNWEKINPAKSETKTGIFSVLTKAFNRKVLKILESPKQTNETEMKRKVQYFYESCIEMKETKDNYRVKLIEIMEEFGGMPALKGDEWDPESFDWIHVIAKILRRYGKQIIISADISPDLKNNQINRIYLGQFSEFIPSKATEYYDGLVMAWGLELRKTLGLDPISAHLAAVDMVQFEKSLAEGMTGPQEGLSIDQLTKLRLLSDMTEEYRPLNVTKFVNIWLNLDYKVPVYEFGLTYLKNLKNVIARTERSVVANYIMWKLLGEFRFDIDSNKKKHLKRCVEATKRYFIKYMDFMVYEDLTRNNKANIIELQQMWLRLKRSFRDILEESQTFEWNEFTKDKALEKLSTMKLVINSYETEDFDKEFGDLVISTDRYFDNVIKVLENKGRNYIQKINEPPKIEESELLNYSPAYAAEYNTVYIPVAFLQPRFLWDNVYPEALKYGTVGYIIAHEMAHGFDDTIRKYDARGNLSNWWDRKSSEIFIKRKDCLMEQFGKMSYNGITLPKIKSQGENIADNMGIRIAFKGYEDFLLQQRPRSEMLPNLNFTGKQLFFIANAQMWCSDINKQLRHLFVSTDVHAPEEVRVIAMYSNFDEFAKEFSCPLDSKMHPTTKCVIY